MQFARLGVLVLAALSFGACSSDDVDVPGGSDDGTASADDESGGSGDDDTQGSSGNGDGNGNGTDNGVTDPEPALRTFTFAEIADASQRHDQEVNMVPPAMSLAYDSVGAKLLVFGFTTGNVERLELNRCNPDGTGCTFTILTDDAYSGYRPSAVVDADGGKFVVVSDRSSTLLLTRCDLDGTNCASNQVTATGAPTNGLGTPSLALDANAGKLVLAATNSAGPLALYLANLDGSSLTYTAGPNAGTNPSLVVDSVHNKYVIAVNGDGLAIVTCDTAFACVTQAIGNGLGDPVDSGAFPRAVLDATGRLFVTSTVYGEGRTFLYRCAWQATTQDAPWVCTSEELTAGLPNGSGYTPAVFIGDDRVGVVRQDAIGGGFRAVTRLCDPTAAGCVDGPAPSASTPADSGYWPIPLVFNSGATRYLVYGTYSFDFARYYRPTLMVLEGY